VRRQRAVKRFTQVQLAEAAGVKRRTVQYLEALGDGDGTAGRWPSLESLIGIEQALDFPPGHLLEMSERDAPADTWKAVRLLLVQAMAIEDPAEVKQVIADALAALGARDHAPR
jgi:transcriptional regulator with XRE-family HTH domain